MRFRPYLPVLLLFFLFAGCEKAVQKFQIADTGETLTLYVDSTYQLLTKTDLESGQWTGGLEGGDTLWIYQETEAAMVNSNCFRVNQDELALIEKSGLNEGWKLADFLNFAQLKQVKIRNVNGPHYLTDEQWQEIESAVVNAASVGGLICKPKWLALIFEFNNGEEVEGTICGDLINFETELTGSFRINKAINLHNF